MDGQIDAWMNGWTDGLLSLIFRQTELLTEALGGSHFFFYLQTERQTVRQS